MSVEQTSMNQLITDNIDVWTSTVKTKSTTGRGSSKKLELYGVKKLRELILELAVRGKLVPQDPNDEPAFVLLERIAKEKAQLIKENKIKKPKKLPEIEQGKPFELPSGWAWSQLGFLTNYGVCDKAESTNVTNDTWVLELEDVEKETSKLLKKVRFSERHFKSSKNVFAKNDVVYGKLRPYLDKVLIADESGVCTTEMIPVRAYCSLTPSFLRLVMKSPYFIRYANNSTHGMNLPRMGTDKARAALFPLPPFDEQHRIVTKVDELMALCDQLEQQTEASIEAHQVLVTTLLDSLLLSTTRAEGSLSNSADAEENVTAMDGGNVETAGASFAQNWERISEHFDTLFTTEASIDQLKQTILQLAVMGKLVPQDPFDEPAAKLLERIAEEKARLIKEKKIKKQKALPPIADDEKPFELPNGWEWCRLPDLGDLARGKSKHRPRNDPQLYQGGTIPLVQTGDVARSSGIIETYTAQYNEVGLAQSQLWPKGTLCITIAANIADTAILGFDACFPDSVVGYTPFDSNIPTKYFDYFIRTAKANLERFAPSTAQKNINLEILSQVLVPCPPEQEFKRVVDRIDELMALCDQLKARLADAQTTQLHLTDAIVEQAV